MLFWQRLKGRKKRERFIVKERKASGVPWLEAVGMEKLEIS